MKDIPLIPAKGMGTYSHERRKGTRQSKKYVYSKRQTKIINGEIPIEDAYQQELVKLINKAAFIGETEIYEKYKKIFEDRIMMREAEKRRKPAPYMSKEEAQAILTSLTPDYMLRLKESVKSPTNLEPKE